MATTEKELSRQTVPSLGAAPPEKSAAEEAAFEADYEEDRPVALLAARRRRFLEQTRGRYVDVDLPDIE